MATIVLERGHHGRTRTGKPCDGGASYRGLVEARLTREYIAHAEDLLTEAGHEVICISDGTYEARAKRANSYGAHLYVACHINAGGYSTGCVFHDYRSTNGKRLAGLVANHLAEVPTIQATRGARVYASTDNPPEGHEYLTRTFATIYSCWPLKPAAICYEPGFIDQPDHAQLWTPEGLRELAEALTQGILDYLE